MLGEERGEGRDNGEVRDEAKGEGGSRRTVEVEPPFGDKGDRVHGR